MIAAESAAISVLWSEINSGHATRRSLAVAYAMVIASHSMRPDQDLEAAHLCMMRAINTDSKGIDKVKQAAWKIYEAAVERRSRKAGDGIAPTVSHGSYQ